MRNAYFEDLCEMYDEKDLCDELLIDQLADEARRAIMIEDWIAETPREERCKTVERVIVEPEPEPESIIDEVDLFPDCEVDLEF